MSQAQQNPSDETLIKMGCFENEWITFQKLHGKLAQIYVGFRKVNGDERIYITEKFPVVKVSKTGKETIAFYGRQIFPTDRSTAQMCSTKIENLDYMIFSTTS